MDCMISLATDDVLIAIFGFLSVSDVLAFRQTCKRCLAISSLKSVWTTACINYALLEGFPFPSKHPSSIEMPELEHRTRHAVYLGNKHRSPSCSIRHSRTWNVNPSNPISDIHFIPGHDDRWLVTVSTGIWCGIACWDLIPPNGEGPRKVCEWGPRGAIFVSRIIAVNPDTQSPVQIAVGILKNDESRIELLSLSSEDGETQFCLVKHLACKLRPVALQGDLLAASDDYDKTKIYNWQTGAMAVLQSSPDASSTVEWNRCLQVIFAHRSILVVRARSVEIFPQPELLKEDEGIYVYHPIASHSFGWLDAIAVSPSATAAQNLSLMFRTTNNDPWSEEEPMLNLYTLFRNSGPLDEDADVENAAPAYTFPPTLLTQTPLIRGPLRCTDIVLRPRGTAVWIAPRRLPAIGLVGMDIHGQPTIPPPESASEGECLVLGTFGSGLMSGDGSKVKPLFWNSSNNWCSMDYSEELGRIVLGRSDGMVTLLEI